MNRCYRCEIPLPDAIDGNRPCADCFRDLTDPGAAQQVIRQLRALFPVSARSLIMRRSFPKCLALTYRSIRACLPDKPCSICYSMQRDLEYFYASRPEDHQTHAFDGRKAAIPPEEGD